MDKYENAGYGGMLLERCIAQDAIRRAVQDALYKLGIPYGWRSPAGIDDYWAGSLALRALPVPAPLTPRELEIRADLCCVKKVSLCGLQVTQMAAAVYARMTDDELLAPRYFMVDIAWGSDATRDAMTIWSMH